jgi:hypothetical protein
MKNLIYIITCMFFISACATENVPDYSKDLHKSGSFKTSKFLISQIDGYSLQSPSRTSDFGDPITGYDTPSEQEYLKNPSEWQKGKFHAYGASAFTSSKILGLIPAGTHYTISKITQSPLEGYATYYYTITSGQFTGITAPTKQY